MIDKPIPKEIKDFQEKIVFGLTGRQLISVILALVVCIPTYIWGRPYLGDDLASWICILVAVPSLAFGFYTKNGMTFEKYMKAVLIFNFVAPMERKYKVENFFEELEKENKKTKGKRRCSNEKDN